LSIASTNRALAPLSTTRKVITGTRVAASLCFQRKSLDWFGDDDLYLPFDHYALYLLCLDAFRVGALLRQMRA
jgi:hypothetical protein